MKKSTYLILILFSVAVLIMFSGCNKKTGIYNIDHFEEETDFIEVSIDFPELKNYKELSDSISEGIKDTYLSYREEAQEFMEEMLSYKDENSEWVVPKYDYDVTFEVTETKKYLSVLVQEYVYLGGAHGGNIFTSYTINKKTGENVGLEKLTGLNFEQISAACRESLIEDLITKNPNNYDWEDLTWLEDYIKMELLPRQLHIRPMW